jgi:hypothetical protein
MQAEALLQVTTRNFCGSSNLVSEVRNVTVPVS